MREKEKAVDFQPGDFLDRPNQSQKKDESVLTLAQRIIYGDREKTYGSPDRNLQLIAKYWSAHINSKGGVDGLGTPRININLAPEDVCIMMVALKLARLANDPRHKDSQVDAAGYLGLMDRIQNVEE